jgi:hypothetical protein
VALDFQGVCVLDDRNGNYRTIYFSDCVVERVASRPERAGDVWPEKVLAPRVRGLTVASDCSGFQLTVTYSFLLDLLAVDMERVALGAEEGRSRREVWTQETEALRRRVEALSARGREAQQRLERLERNLVSVQKGLAKARTAGYSSRAAEIKPEPLTEAADAHRRSPSRKPGAVRTVTPAKESSGLRGKTAPEADRTGSGAGPALPPRKEALGLGRRLKRMFML